MAEAAFALSDKNLAFRVGDNSCDADAYVAWRRVS